VQRRIAVDRVPEPLEGPLAACVAGLTPFAGALSTYWESAIRFAIHRPGAHPPQGDVR